MKRQKRDQRPRERESRPWFPKTALGKKVQKGEAGGIDDILQAGQVILEPQIVDTLVPDVKEEVIYIGGSPGKGGGIRRTATRRTARMHKSGRRYKLSAVVVVGDGRGIVGVGKAATREHHTALEKAAQQARMNVIRVRKGCGSWECNCGGDHSIPFKVEGRCGSVRIILIPGPKGLGIVANPTGRKVLGLAGLHDVWVKAFGNTGARMNFVYAMFDAIKNLNRTKGAL